MPTNRLSPPVRLQKYQPAQVSLCPSTSSSGIVAQIITEDLYMRSIKEEDIQWAQQLYGDAEVMAKFAESKPRSFNVIEEKVNGWVKRWQTSDPYSAFIVFNKRDPTQFIGIDMLGATSVAGTAEFSIAHITQVWRKGLGFQAAAALVIDYAAELAIQQFVIHGAILGSVIATARVDNEGSNRILVKLGMRHEKTSDERYQELRHYYRISVPHPCFSALVA